MLNLSQKLQYNWLFLSVQLSSVKWIHIVVQLISRTFSPSPTEATSPLNNDSPFPQPLAANTLISSSMNLTTLGTSYKWNHLVFVLLGLAYFA